MAQESRINTNTAAKTAPIAKIQVKAFARHIHMSPQKLRLVADVVRNESVEAALEQLRFSSKKAALPIAKLINSAVANAIHNFNLNKENLYIKTLSVDGGPVSLRYRPRAQGRAGAIRHRTSHINVILEERMTNKKRSNRSVFNAFARQSKPEVVEHKHDHDHEPEEGKVEEKVQHPKIAPKTEEKQKQQKVSLKRRLFNRKSGQ